MLRVKNATVSRTVDVLPINPVELRRVTNAVLGFRVWN